MERGQLVIGRRELAESLGWSESQVRRALDILTKGGQITRQPVTNRGTVVTVSQYDNYNKRPDENYQRFIQRVTGESTRGQPEGNQTTTTNNELYELDKKIEEAPALSSSAVQQIAEAAIADLNQRTKGKLTPQKTLTAIHWVGKCLVVRPDLAAEDFITVNRKKCPQWLPDAKLRHNLVPKTLYRPDPGYFFDYLDEPEPEGEDDPALKGWTPEMRAAAKKAGKR